MKSNFIIIIKTELLGFQNDSFSVFNPVVFSELISSTSYCSHNKLAHVSTQRERAYPCSNTMWKCVN